MDVATSVASLQSPSSDAPNGGGTVIEKRETNVATTMQVPSPFVKKSAAQIPAIPLVPGAKKISITPNPGGGVMARVKMTASVVMEMPSGYKHIDHNIYVSRPEIKLKTHELPRCHCKEGQRCSPSECENAMVFIECSPKRCPVGDTCLNQRFQKRQYAGIYAKKCGAKGWGIFAQLPISAGQFVIEYVGEVIDADELDVRSKACENDPHYYFLSISGGETIDASKKGNISRFINHSCDPNCITQKWQVNGESRVGIFALRNIRVGEELTFDYQFERFSHKKQRCLCGASNCSKWLGSKPKPKDGDPKSSRRKEKEVVRYMEVSEAVLPDEHVAVLLDDQAIESFPFTPIDERWYFQAKDKIPMESDTEEESSSSTSDSDSEDDSPTNMIESDGTKEPPNKVAKLKESQTPQNGYQTDTPKHASSSSNVDSDSDSDDHPCHLARDYVNKVENGAPLFRRTSAHQERLRLLDRYTELLYDKIDAHKEKKSITQDATIEAMSTLMGVDAAKTAWMASLDIKQLIKDGLLEFSPATEIDRAQNRRSSTRSAKRS